MKLNFEMEINIPDEWINWYFGNKDEKPTEKDLDRMVLAVFEFIEDHHQALLDASDSNPTISQGVEWRIIRPQACKDQDSDESQ